MNCKFVTEINFVEENIIFREITSIIHQKIRTNIITNDDGAKMWKVGNYESFDYFCTRTSDTAFLMKVRWYGTNNWW